MASPENAGDGADCDDSNVGQGHRLRDASSGRRATARRGL